MADFTSHKPGTFSWPELATTDQKAGVAFYRALFGWDLNEQPMGPGETLFDVPAARQARRRRLHDASGQNGTWGVPPHWNSYVTVANVDESGEESRIARGEGVSRRPST